MILIEQGTTVKLPVYLVDSTDHVTAETGVTSPTLTISKNGGSLGALSDGTWAELAGGMYTVQVNATDTNTVGPLIVRVVKAGCDDYRCLAYVRANTEADIITALGDVPTDAENATAVWAAGTRTLTANTNLNDPTAADVATAVWAAAARTLTANTNFNDPTASAIATAVWANATRVLTANTNFNDPTAEDISAAVWAETTRTLTDLTGLEVDITAPSVTDIDTYLTAQHGAGSWEGGGTAPSVEEIDAELTDNHGSGSWQTGGTGSGAVACTYTTTETDGTTPISSVFVWVTSDLAGANLIASGWTDVNGEVTFNLTSGATVYVWRSKSGYNFSNPDTEVVP